jgi:hypothetical protein
MIKHIHINIFERKNKFFEIIFVHNLYIMISETMHSDLWKSCAS